MMKIVGKHYLKVTLKAVIDEVGYHAEAICRTLSLSWAFFLPLCSNNYSGEGILEES